jgi:hypothetical protein
MIDAFDSVACTGAEQRVNCNSFSTAQEEVDRAIAVTCTIPDACV